MDLKLEASVGQRKFLAGIGHSPLSLNLTVATNIICERMRLGIDQPALARLAGIPAAALAEIEGATRTLKIDQVAALAAALSVTAHRLLGPVEVHAIA